jgi:hypothetical protein
MNSRSAAAALSAIAASAWACASQPANRAGQPETLPALRPPSVVPEDFVFRQRVTAQVAGREARSFDAMLEKKGDRLALVGLTPLGTVLFAASLEGTRLAFEDRTGEDLPFPPEYVLLDVQRVFFPWLPPPPDGSGVREGAVFAERVIERWAGGRLVERTFACEAAGAPARVRVAFDNGARGIRSAILTNECRSYVLTIENVQENPID